MKKIMVAILTLAVLVPPAAAQESPPPKTRLRSGDTVQRGLQSSYCWETTCADYISRWPDARGAERGAKATIKVDYAKKPSNFSISSYSSVDENDFPSGDEEFLDHTWRAVKRDGKTIAWKAVFHLPDRTGHAYMRVFAGWKDQGDSSWTFHLKLS